MVNYGEVSGDVTKLLEMRRLTFNDQPNITSLAKIKN